MTEPISFGEMDVNLTSSLEGGSLAQPTENLPYRVALLGDFSGRMSRHTFSPDTLKPIRVDRDNLEDLPGKLNTEIHLSLAGNDQPMVIRIEELDEFHPDQLYNRLDAFQSLKKLRRALNDTNAYEDAAAEVRQWLNIPDSSQEKEALSSPVDEVDEAPTSGSGLLDAIIGESPGAEPVSVKPQQGGQQSTSDMDAFLKVIVGPHLVPKEDPQKEELIAAVDVAISELMKAVLHHPDFQAVESAWRSLAFLIRRLDTDEKVQIFLCDHSKEEFAGALTEGEDLSRTIIYNQFVEKSIGTMGGTPWSLLVGMYTFEQTHADIEILGRMAKCAALSGAPFVTEASFSCLGCSSLDKITDPSSWRDKPEDDIVEAWNQLRSLPESNYLGLALFRLLLRLPYGEDTDPIDMFDLEEFPSDGGHDDYLWGNPAVGLAYLLGLSFVRFEWQMRGSLEQDIQNLPMHIYKEDDETYIKPCSEVVLTDRAASEIIDTGFMPMLSFMNQDRVRLGRFQSLNKNSIALAGRW